MGRPATWGGFLEVSLIVQMWSPAPEAGGGSSPVAEEAPLTVLILQDNGAGGFQTLSVFGSSALDDAHLSCWRCPRSAVLILSFNLAGSRGFALCLCH